MWKRIRIPFVAALAIWIAGAVQGISVLKDQVGLKYEPTSGFQSLFQGALFDLAIAILIAIMTAEIVEKDYKNRQQIEDASRQKKSISTHVREMMNGFFGEDVINEAIDAIFKRSILRESYSIEYTFTPHSNNELLELTMLVNYTVKNISPITENFSPICSIPNLMSHFPNSVIDSPPSLLAASIDISNGSHIKLDSTQLSRLNNNIDCTKATCTVDIGTFPIPAGECLSVTTEVRVIKLASDEDVIRMFAPTKNVQIKVNNDAGQHISIDIAPIWKDNFPEKRFIGSSQSKWIWRPIGLFLPMNGWVLYWNDTRKTFQ